MSNTIYINCNYIFCAKKLFNGTNTLTQCPRIKVPVRDINFRFFKYFAMEWWGGMVWPPSGPKKFGRTHWAAGLGRFRCQNRQKEANSLRKNPHKSFVFWPFLTFGGSNMTRRVAKSKIGEVAASCGQI